MVDEGRGVGEDAMATRGLALRRVYAHLRLHGLEASVEAREHAPAGASRPAVVCDEAGQQVVSVSPAARQRGVRDGLSRWEAQRRCPELLVAEPDPEKYRYCWQRVLDICGDYSPEVRPLRPLTQQEPTRDLVLDLTGTERLLGPAKAVGQELRNRLQAEVAVVATVGLGPTRLVARLACEMARPGEVVEIAAEETAEFLGRAPLAALPGVSAEFALQLAALGLQRGRDLAALPPDAVARALGEQGRRLQKIVRGEAGEEEPTMIGERAGEEEPGVAAQAELRPPTGEKERILAAFRRAAEEVARILREQGQVGSRIRIDLVFRDLRTVGARRTLRQATRSEEVIFHTAQDLFARARLGDRLVRRVRIRIGRLVVGPQGGQLALPLLPQEARRERLSEMVSRVRDRFGERAVTRGAVLALRER